MPGGGRESEGTYGYQQQVVFLEVSQIGVFFLSKEYTLITDSLSLSLSEKIERR